MNIVLAIAIFFIIWWVVLFVVLPVGVRTQEEAGDVVPGTPESAPATTNMPRVFAWTTVISLAVFANIYWFWTSPLGKSWIDAFFMAVMGMKIFDGA